MDRRRFGLGVAAGLSVAGIARGQAAMTLAKAQETLLLGGDVGAAAQVVRDHGRADAVAGLILALRYTRVDRGIIGSLLAEVTGADHGTNWFDWMIWQEGNPQVVPHPSYAGFKRDMFLRIDANFADFLVPEYLQRDRMKIRLEEITWGGVRKDGIPSLDNPRMIRARRANYLRDDDLVFGVSINGDARAYPLRIMGWHEMFNDVIGDVPVALAYCTLCGSGILFETQVDGRRKPLVFGSSGFLYRSNKLMFDRETHSLWNQFTGQPVVGPLVNSGVSLVQRPVVIAPWQDWRQANPETRVLSLRTGHNRDYGSGVVYNDYFSSPDLMFPTIVDQRLHRQKDYVFGVRVFGAAKAWPIEVFAGGRVLNDAIADRPLVLIGDADSRTVRAYERGGLTFVQTPGGVRSDDGTLWVREEEALAASDGRRLPRVAGHIAYWFAWNGYLGAESELYGG